MAQEIATQDQARLLEKVVIENDLSQLTSAERNKYYTATCESLGLNPLTRPFQYLRLNNKLTLYATKDASEQLTRNYQVSLEKRGSEDFEGVRIITYRATDPTGRFVDATGVVSIAGLKGDNLANALMKAETKASRRATLRLVGLGWLDETETETIRGAMRVDVSNDGEIIGETPVIEPKKETPKKNVFATTSDLNDPNVSVVSDTLPASSGEVSGYAAPMEEEEELIEPEPPYQEDAADESWCPLHEIAWFPTKNGPSHPITAERGHVEGGETLLNKQGYQRWCKQPVNGLSQTHFWQTYKSLGFETQDAVESYMEATVSQIQSLYDVDEGNHGPVLKHLINQLVNKG
tara:strand:+ start:1189 stop:2235 length:1047 start_codon:yes stop_codon:yes gene_type:complete